MQLSHAQQPVAASVQPRQPRRLRASRDVQIRTDQQYPAVDPQPIRQAVRIDIHILQSRLVFGAGEIDDLRILRTDHDRIIHRQRVRVIRGPRKLRRLLVQNETWHHPGKPVVARGDGGEGQVVVEVAIPRFGRGILGVVDRQEQRGGRVGDGTFVIHEITVRLAALPTRLHGHGAAGQVLLQAVRHVAKVVGQLDLHATIANRFADVGKSLAQRRHQQQRDRHRDQHLDQREAAIRAASPPARRGSGLVCDGTGPGSNRHRAANRPHASIQTEIHPRSHWKYFSNTTTSRAFKSSPGLKPTGLERSMMNIA